MRIRLNYISEAVNTMTDKNENIKVYLDYLDKEMTIMGVLSTFCVFALGFSADKLLFQDTKILGAVNLWNSSYIYCLLGLFCFSDCSTFLL